MSGSARAITRYDSSRVCAGARLAYGVNGALSLDRYPISTVRNGKAIRSRMNILAVMRNAPAPTTGYPKRNLALLKALCQEHRVSLLVVADDPARETRVASALTGQVAAVQVVPAVNPRLKRLLQVGGLLVQQPSIIWRYSSGAVKRELRHMLASGEFDAVYFEGIMVTGHKLTEEHPRPLVIVDEHNLEWELLERSAQQSTSPVRRLHYQREGDSLRRVELATLRNANLVVVTSERERSILRTLLPHARICVAPNGVDAAAFAPDPSHVEISGRIVFTASMDYRPNEEAAHYFVMRCWPLVRQAYPAATLYLVGANPPRSFASLADAPGVTITGAVPETRTYLAEAQVAIVPLLVGGGTRLKILEALAMGKTVVSTTLGFEGIDVTPGEHLLAADEPGAFAKQVIRALGNPELRARLGAAGREIAVQRYSWERSGAALRTSLTELGAQVEVAHVALADR